MDTWEDSMNFRLKQDGFSSFRRGDEVPELLLIPGEEVDDDIDPQPVTIENPVIDRKSTRLNSSH